MMTRMSCDSAIRFLSFSPLSDTTCKVTGFHMLADEEMTTLEIPETDAEGRRVIAVDDRAFTGMSVLKRVDLPASIQWIGVRAFAFCENLMEVRFGSGNGHYSDLSYIGDRAFMGCECLTVLSLGELHSQLLCGRKAFAHCTHLRAVVLPDSMTELSEGMFEGCRSLIYVRLPEELTVIRTSAFSACVSLPAISLPSKVRRIDDCAFSFCGALESIALPEAVCMISASAFLDCPARPDFMKAVS